MMSSSGRIGSLSLLNDTLRDVNFSQSRLADLSSQISSGFKSPNFEGINGDVEQLSQLNAQLSRVTQYKAVNQVNASKLQTADAALGRISDVADKIKNAIIGANGSAVKTSNLPQIVGDLLKSIGGELNTTFSGHYLFGGIETVNPPVPSTNVSNTALGAPDDNYYAGAKQDATLRADDRTELTFPVRADDIAFQKIYAAAKQAIIGAQNNDASQLQQAQQLIQSGQNDLIAARSKLGGTMVTIDSIGSQLDTLVTYWKELSDGISKTDIVAASTEVSSYQAILQASFQVYARLSQLHLSSFLN